MLRSLLGAALALCFAGSVQAGSSPAPQPAKTRPPYIRICGLGDSKTAENDMTLARNPAIFVNAHEAVGPITWARWLSNGAVYMPQSLNFGVSGNTTTQVLVRLDAVVAAKPDACIVEIGTNDLVPGNNITPATTIAQTKQIIQRLQAAGIFVVYVPILPRASWGGFATSQVPTGQRSLQYINKVMTEWARQQLDVLVLDMSDITGRQDAFTATLTSGGTTAAVLPTSLTGPGGSSSPSSAVDGYYNYWRLVLNSSAGYGQPVMITNYVGSTRTVTFALPSTTTAFAVAATANTLTRSDGGSFITDGFVVGAAVTTSGFTNGGNNGGGTISALTDTVMTVTRSLTSETSPSSAKVTITTPTSATTFALDPFGTSKDGVNQDGLHESAYGASIEGQRIATALAGITVPRYAGGSQDVGLDPTYNPIGNILRNPNMIGTGKTPSCTNFTGSLPRSWDVICGATYTSTATTRTLSKTARSDLVGGEWTTMTIAGLTSGLTQEKYFIRQTITPGPNTYQVGTTLKASCDVLWSNAVALNAVSLEAYLPGSANNPLMYMDGRNQDLSGNGLLDELTGVNPPNVMRFETEAFTLADYSDQSSASLIVQLEVNMDAAAAGGSVTLNLGRCRLSPQ